MLDVVDQAVLLVVTGARQDLPAPALSLNDE